MTVFSSDTFCLDRLSKRSPPHLIGGEAEAVTCALQLAERFAIGASERDRERRLPYDEVDEFSSSGLWAITIPKLFGGAGLSYVTLASVIKTISKADPNIGQIPQSHYYMLAVLQLGGSQPQKQEILSLVASGARIGNAIAESRRANSREGTRLKSSMSGYLLSGTKGYCTGSLFADLVAVSAQDENGLSRFVFVACEASGLAVRDDWSSFGQRTTASGTIEFNDVLVAKAAVIPNLPGHRALLAMAVGQLLHASIDLGIALAAMDDMIECVRSLSGTWPSSGATHARNDPLSLRAVGNLEIKLQASEALLERAGRAIDAAFAADSEEPLSTRAAVLALQAKVACVEVAMDATNQLFELGGARVTLGDFNLDRHWRNARTHSLHDPVRWRTFEIGNYRVNGEPPSLPGGKRIGER